MPAAFLTTARRRNPEHATETDRRAPRAVFAHPLRDIMAAVSKNVLGQPLHACCSDPLTGFYRDGFCRTGDEDLGRHTVCAVMTGEFLEFSRAQGNDLSTPQPAVGFPGLKPGDRWCLCASRWADALEAGSAPPIVLQATAEEALERVSFDDLFAYAKV
jgi:uncharacterized protein (DUF2237 family)